MLKTAVIGTGYLGSFHAHKYTQIPNCHLVGVVDTNPDNGRRVAQQCQTRYYPHHQALLGQVDAVSVVVPTAFHYEIVRDFLQAGSHVLVEKPMSQHVHQAQELAQIARAKKRVLQVGFLERFNAAFTAVAPLIKKPRFIESHRLTEFKQRAMNINVVMDLMIHDLDIVLELVRSPLAHIAANGAAVLSSSVDIAQTRLTFQCGCVANITASRISHKSKRKLRVFQEASCIYVDFQALKTSYFYKGQDELFPGIPRIECQEQSYSDDDALKKEIEDFIHCIHHSRRPRATGEEGRRALELAWQISRLIEGGSS